MVSPDTVRFAQFNASLNRNNAGELITDLSTPDNAQAKTVAEIIQRTNPDVLLTLMKAVRRLSYFSKTISLLVRTELIRLNIPTSTSHLPTQAFPLALT
jgi:hypothetical protein